MEAHWATTFEASLKWTNLHQQLPSIREIISKKRPREEISEKPSKKIRNSGTWTPEEDSYAKRLIRDFKCGILYLPESKSLRAYLSESLNCNPMRVTKRYSKEDEPIGKFTFRPESFEMFPQELRNIADNERRQLRINYLYSILCRDIRKNRILSKSPVSEEDLCNFVNFIIRNQSNYRT